MTNEHQAQWSVTCQCGWRTQGSRKDVVLAVQEHGRKEHGVELTPEQVIAQATQVDPA